MPIPIDEQLSRALQSVANKTHKLIVLPRNPVAGLIRESGKFQVLNLSKRLATALLPLSPKDRCRKAQGILEKLLKATDLPIVLDHIELLFEPSLGLQPLPLLKQLSRSKILIVLWPGQVYDRQLTYAQPMHGEYQNYDSDDLNEILIIPSNNDQ